MRLRPRHYLLIAVLLGLGLWNLVRSRRALHSAGTAATVSGSPAWQAFDRAAALRDAPEAQFSPTLDQLKPQTDAATGPDAADLRDCQMWLLYYRHSVPMAAGRSGDWSRLATGHVQSCMTTHRDIGR